MPYPRPKPPAGGLKAAYPGFVAPALATSITKVPSGVRWIHEIKFDGYRVQVHIKDGAHRERFTRAPQAVGPECPALQQAHRGIWVEPTLLAEIEYRAKSAEDKVRHPVLKGLREDL
jgi:ATP-dependent DNA ligase